MRHASISNGHEIMILGGWFSEKEAETENWNIESQDVMLIDPTLRDTDYYNLALFVVEKNFCKKGPEK